MAINNTLTSGLLNLPNRGGTTTPAYKAPTGNFLNTLGGIAGNINNFMTGANLRPQTPATPLIQTPQTSTAQSQQISAPQPPVQQPPTQSQGTPNVQTYGPGGSGLSPEQIAAANAAEDKRVAAGTPNIIQPNNPNNPPTGDVNPTASLTLGGLVPQLLRNAGQNPAVMKAQQELQDLRNQRATAVNQIQGAPGLGLQESSGQQGLLENLFATKEKAAIENLANAQQEQQIQQKALGTAVGAVAPVLGGAGQVPFTPATGEQGQILGGQGGGFDINSLATQVANGQMTMDQANSALGGNIALSGALRAAITKINPQFNFAQASALGATQGQVAPQLQMAQTALNNLVSTFNSIPEWQKTSVPLVNSLSNLLGAVGIGTGTATSKSNAINEARTQVANALGVMTNSTPTSWTSMVNQWFPDNATPDQVQAGMQQFNNLAKNRQQIYGQPGGVQPFSGNQTQGGGATPFSFESFWQ